MTTDREWHAQWRDGLGREVRAIGHKWAHEQSTPPASWLVPYDTLGEAEQELYRRIGQGLFIAGSHASTARHEETIAALTDALTAARARRTEQDAVIERLVVALTAMGACWREDEMRIGYLMISGTKTAEQIPGAAGRCARVREAFLLREAALTNDRPHDATQASARTEYEGEHTHGTLQSRPGD